MKRLVFFLLFLSSFGYMRAENDVESLVHKADSCTKSHAWTDKDVFCIIGGNVYMVNYVTDLVINAINDDVPKYKESFVMMNERSEIYPEIKSLFDFMAGRGMPLYVKYKGKTNGKEAAFTVSPNELKGFGSKRKNGWKCLGNASVKCKRRCMTYEDLEYEITIPKSDNSFTPYTNFNGFGIAGGPYMSEKHSQKTVKGRKVDLDSITYKYKLYLSNEGTYTIPSGEMKCYRTNEYYVVPETQIIASDSSVNEVKTVKSTNDVLLRWNVCSAKGRAVGDVISCQLELLYKCDIRYISFLKYNNPDNAYISTVDTSEYVVKQPDTIISGTKYHRYVINDYDVVPLKSGKMTLPECVLVCTVNKPSKGRGFFSEFFVDNLIDTVVAASAECLRIKGKQLYNQTVSLKNKGVAVCCDVSGTMRCKDDRRTRIEIAKEVIEKLADANSAIQYMAFAGRKEFDWCDNIKHYLDTFTTPLADGTSLYDAMLYSISSEKYFKDVIVITDGTDNGSHVSVNITYGILKEYGVRPYVIYINSLKDSVVYEPYIGPDTAKNENKYLLSPFNIRNDKFSDEELKTFRAELQALGGDLFIIKDEDEVEGVLKKLQDMIKDNSKTEEMRTITSKNAAYQYVLRRLKDDF